jgi:hypothetical protein
LAQTLDAKIKKRTRKRKVLTDKDDGGGDDKDGGGNHQRVSPNCCSSPLQPRVATQQTHPIQLFGLEVQPDPASVSTQATFVRRRRRRQKRVKCLVVFVEEAREKRVVEVK